MNQIAHWVNKFWELARKKLKSKKVWYTQKKVEIPLETLVDSRFVTKKVIKMKQLLKLTLAYIGHFCPQTQIGSVERHFSLAPA